MRINWSTLTKKAASTIILLFAITQLFAEPLELTKEAKAALIDSISTKLTQIYVFPDKALEMEKLIRKNLKKSYKAITDPREFADKLTEDLRSVYNDLHLNVFVTPPDVAEQDISEEEMEKIRIEKMRKENFGFKEVKILEGNIGYLDLRAFIDISYAGTTAEGAMKFLENTDALIIDLRQNGGGSPSMIQFLSSYFFKDATHLNSFYVRESESMDQYWTQSYVPGKKYLNKPIYILTSDYTFSAAEEFSYNLKNLERATLIGEVTGGGAHPVSYHLFNDLGFALKLPFGKAVNPISQSNWEGVGVKPHIEVSAKKALNEAQLHFLNEKIEEEKSPHLKAKLEWEKESLKAKLNPVTLSSEQLKVYEGQFGPRFFKVADNQLIYSRDNQKPAILIAMGNHTFMLQDATYFRLKFELDSNGKAIKVIGMYDDGNWNENMRTD